MRFSRSGWAMIAALAIVVMVSQAAMAQQQQQGRRGNRGGGGGNMASGLRLATIEPVQKALKLTDEQKDKIKDINDGMREELRKAFEDGGAREKMQELNDNATKKLNAVLDEGQQKRLMGIEIQVAGAAAVADPAVAKELNVTEDQKKKLEEVRDANREAMREAFQGARDGDRDAIREKMEKFRDESNKKILAVLTSDQQAQLESLKGEKVEIDPAALRGPGGQGGRNGGQRGNRGGQRNPESKSAN